MINYVGIISNFAMYLCTGPDIELNRNCDVRKDASCSAINGKTLGLYVVRSSKPNWSIAFDTSILEDRPIRLRIVICYLNRFGVAFSSKE